MHVHFLSPDLLFASRVQAATQRLGKTFRSTSPIGLQTATPDVECRLVFIDLANLGAVNAALIEPIRAACPHAKVIAFGPHVDDTVLAAAREAGCDEVQTRGQFHREFAELIAATFAEA